MVNRCVVTVRAKRPFREWLMSLPNQCDPSLEYINKDNTAFLLPEYARPSDQKELLREYFGDIFEEQLSGWSGDEGDWPENRDLPTFKKWFDVQFHSLVFDLADEPLVVEE